MKEEDPVDGVDLVDRIYTRIGVGGEESWEKGGEQLVERIWERCWWRREGKRGEQLVERTQRVEWVETRGERRREDS